MLGHNTVIDSATIWMDLKIIMLSERSQTKKKKVHTV